MNTITGKRWEDCPEKSPVPEQQLGMLVSLGTGGPAAFWEKWTTGSSCRPGMERDAFADTQNVGQQNPVDPVKLKQ